MTTAQKVIKYIATAFAIFLIVTIISAILTGIFGLLSAFGLVHSEKNIVTDEVKVISSEVTDISTLKLELAFTNLEIITGESFRVETNNSKISFTDNNGSIKIKEENHNWLMNHNYTSDLIIYIPENIMTFDEVKIETGAGKINIQSLNTQGLYLELGAGDVYIENLIVAKEAKIDGGARKNRNKIL